MNRLEFINALGARLSVLSQVEVQRVLEYYLEAVDDRMEDGMSEAEAIASLGDLDALAESILREQGHLTLPDAPRETPPEKGRRWWMIPVLIVTSPMWAWVLAAVWALIGSAWVVSVSFLAGGILSAAGSLFLPVYPDAFSVRLLACGLGLALAGFGLMLLPACRALTRACARGHGRLFRWLGRTFRREAA